MHYIAHRVNTIEQLAQTPTDLGVELDLRDRGERLILQHEPFADGEDFTDYLRHYRHGLMVLNIKSERIEWRVLEAVKKFGVQNYFFLDCSFPMIRQLVARGERRIAARFSEFEPIESVLALAGQIEWVWIDCFTRMPLTDATYESMKSHFKLCVVSPELQGRDVSTISEYARQLAAYPFDAVCSKRPDLWRQALGGKG